MTTYFITGANRGLGLQFTRQLSDRGDRVFATCRDPESATEVSAIAADHPDLVTILPLDVSDMASVQAAAQALDDAPIDVLINNAGVYGGNRQALGSIDYADWARTLDINVFGPTRVLECLLPNLAASDRKLAVTITSGMGSLGDNPGGHFYAYRSSKSAVNMVMKNASNDLRSRGIATVVMNPGWVQTDMGGPHATITPETSITAMLKVIDRLDMSETGTFYNYTGEHFPW